MKTLSGFAIVLALLMLNACTPNVESKVEESQESTFEVYSVHDIEINQDVDSKEFETFVMNELAPIYNKMKGQKFLLVKGDRGVRKDKYAIILTFESVEDRDRIYPPSGEFVGDFGDDSVWEKFRSMTQGLDGTKHTDYVKVVQ